MWSLKYEYYHKDCTYSPMCRKLGVRLHGQPINCYSKDEALYITAIHHVEGPSAAVRKYLAYLKKSSSRMERISDDTVFTLAKKTANLEYYQAIYTPQLFFPEPVLHDGKKEYGHVMSWDRQVLVNLIEVIKSSHHTSFFKLLHLKNSPVHTMFTMRVVDGLTRNQREVFTFASREGYYAYPRRVNLGQIAKQFHISKSSCHETLRRAETNLLHEVMTPPAIIERLSHRK
jgi:predicted DNA binding protein